MSWSLTPLDPSEDWELWDGVESVNYYRFASDADEGDYYQEPDEIFALFREIQSTNVPVGEGETTVAQVLVTIPASAIGNRMPRRFDKIKRLPTVQADPQPEYIVQYASASTLGTRYKCWCTKTGAGALI